MRSKLARINVRKPMQIKIDVKDKKRKGSFILCTLFVFSGLRLNNAWASGTVLRPFLQPERPLSSRSVVSGFKCKLRDSNSRPPYSRQRALTTRHIHHPHFAHEWCIDEGLERSTPNLRVVSLNPGACT